MPKKPEEQPETEQKPVMSAEDYANLKADYSRSKTNMATVLLRWKGLLDIAYARLSTEKGFKSRVREGSLSSLLWERAARVAAQPATGRIRALHKRDTGKSMLMNLVWGQHIIPHANTDFSFMTKLRLWDYYSLVFGAMPMGYDYRIDDEYVGPDCTLINPFNCFPQAGRTSLHNCRRVYVESFHDREYLEAKKKLDDWNSDVIEKILKDFDDKSTPTTDGNQTTGLQEERDQVADLHQGQIKLVTRYERGKEGRWVTFAPDFECELPLRSIKNPHESGRIPIVFKYAMPLIDSIWGMGDVERGESLQKAVDTAVNMSLDMAKFKLYPPMWYTDKVNKSQLRYEPYAKWKLPSAWGTEAGFVATGSQPSQEFQLVYQFLKGALLNQNGTTDTTISSQDKMPGFGRTPEALQQLEKRENARDQWDRSMFEEAYEELTNGMINLVGSKQAVAMEFHIFDEDIEELVKAGYTDILDIYDSAYDYSIENGKLNEQLNKKGTAKISIAPERLRGKYMFQVDANSSAANDEAEEYERTKGVMEDLNTPVGQRMLQEAEAAGRGLDYVELLDRYLTTTGIRNRDRIFPQTAQQTSKQFDPNSITDPVLREQYDQLIQNRQQPAPAAAAPTQPVAPAGGTY